MTDTDYVIYSDCDDVCCTVNMTDDRHTDHVIFCDWDDVHCTVNMTDDRH